MCINRHMHSIHRYTHTCTHTCINININLILIYIYTHSGTWNAFLISLVCVLGQSQGTTFLEDFSQET